MIFDHTFNSLKAELKKLGRWSVRMLEKQQWGPKFREILDWSFKYIWYFVGTDYKKRLAKIEVLYDVYGTDILKAVKET